LCVIGTESNLNLQDDDLLRHEIKAPSHFHRDSIHQVPPTAMARSWDAVVLNGSEPVNVNKLAHHYFVLKDMHLMFNKEGKQ
jgi:hypothetical protein